MGDDQNSSAVPETLASTRSRRSKADTSGRFAALEKLRNSRSTGQKNKYEVTEMQNVYDIVDEKEYSKRVHDRQRDDWIIDDGSGYVEDGREIFDEELEDAEDAARRKRKARLSKKDKDDSRMSKESNQANFQSVRDMLSNMPQKRKRTEMTSSAGPSVDQETLLSDLMQELKNEKKAGPSTSTAKLIQKIATPQLEPMKVPKKVPEFVIKPELKKFKPTVSYANNKTDYSSPSTSTYNTSKLTDNSSADAFDCFDDDFTDNMDFDEPLELPVESQPKTKPPTKVLSETQPKAIVKPNVPAADADVVIKAEPGVPIKTELVDEDMSMYMDESAFEGEMSSEAMCTDAPTMVNEEPSGSKWLNFYWLDMYEEPRNPGVIYLFGKVKATPPATGYSSCCVIVKNLTRKVFLLPKETKDDGSPNNCQDVHNEFRDVIAPKYKIPVHKTKTVTKKYCFEMTDVPPVADYREVRYSGLLPILPQDLKGETFSKAFGTNTPLMETFLLEKKLKGPSWLRIFNCEQILSANQQSWSKFEFSCDVTDVTIHPESSSLPPPTLVLVSLNLQSVTDAGSKKESLIFAGVSVNKNFHLQSPLPANGIYHDFFCLINKPPGEVWPLDVDRIVNKRTLKMDSERSMLGCLLAKLHQIDPDVYLGHDLNFELLLLQLLHLKVPHWSRIGRLKRSNLVTKNKMLDYRAALAGRLLCDVKISAMELIRARSYDLPSLSSQVLGMKEDQVATLTGPEMKQLFDSSEGLRNFVNWGMQHCVINIRLINELQVMPLAVQITAIAGNTLCRTLLGGRAERNEYLLLHAFTSHDYIVPDKFKPFVNKSIKKESGEGEEEDKKVAKSGPSYSGGLVLAPKKGFYDDFIVLMDFNSLYPSIIQEYNVCFTTNVANEDGSEDNPVEDGRRGILPDEIRKLVESRKQVKGLMKGSNVSPDLMRQYDIRQKALKLTANSMYGCLGFRLSRFYAQNLAAYITGKGRDILLKTKDQVEKLGFEVIYGDTDSLMINSHTQDIKQVFQIGNKIKSEINRTYRLLELEIDGIFRFLLLLKKKKYAAMLCNLKPDGEKEYVLELKGLDMVRRDWAPIASNTARSCLNEIMSEQPLDDKIYKVCKILNDVGDQLREGKIPLKELLITKQLAKHPEEYKNAAGLYHVEVALRMNKSGKMPKKFRNGDTVSYLFCTDGKAHHLTELGKPVEVVEPKKEEDGGTDEKEVKQLTPDPVYYLANQVHPVVSRICDPIPGLDPARIADSLGLDSTSYKRRRVIEENEDKFLGHQSEAEKYNECEKLTFQCVMCNWEIKLTSPLFRKNKRLEFCLETCPNEECRANPWGNTIKFKNHLTIFIRKFINKYYKNTFICEDPSCSGVTSTMPLHLERGYPVCSCKQALMYKDYSDAQLYRQLNYLHFVFDLNKGIEELTKEEKTELKSRLFHMRAKNADKSELELIYQDLQSFVKKTLDHSAYSHIDLKNMFALISIRKAG